MGFLHRLHNFVWSPGMLILFLATGMFFTVKFRFFQVLHMPLWISETLLSVTRKKEVRKTQNTHEISQFQSFCTALAATLGTGNITGVATAILTGGPGAVFWMWVSAVLGMMTNYAENYLGIRYREKQEDGTWSGGAMMYMEKGLNCRWLAVIFAICCLGASFGMGNMVQGNAMASGLKEAFGIPVFFSGMIVLLGTAGIVTGGVKRIASWMEKLVPVMAVLYLGGAAVVLFMHSSFIDDALRLIFREAFHLRSAGGGMAGYGMMQAIRMGIARGIFSNEAGLGSTVMAHAQSNVKSPSLQGMWGIAEIFIDTIVVCTVTALVILTSGVYDMEACLWTIRSGSPVPDGTTLTGMAFETVLPCGKEILAISTVLFAFATIIGWSCFGEQTARWLWGKKGSFVYQIVYVFLTLPGCMMVPAAIWEVSDTLNGMMALPNLAALWLLAKQVKMPNKKDT